MLPLELKPPYRKPGNLISIKEYYIDEKLNI